MLYKLHKICNQLYNVYYNKTSSKWLEDKRAIDDLDGFWRVHDNLYDVTDFIDNHPGGKFWLETTKGMDITEAFETHHIKSEAPEIILQKYFVKKANKPRVSQYTFHENGFYKTLKRNVRTVLKTLPKDCHKANDMYTDLFFVTAVIFACLGSAYSTYLFLFIASIFAGFTLLASHNYSHQRDNFRMLYAEFFMLPAREFRILHCISHHAFTNSRLDIQFTIGLPLMNFFPEKKSFVVKYLAWFTTTLFIFPIIISFLGVMGNIENLIHKRNIINVLTTFALPFVMYCVGNGTTLSTIGMWIFILLIANSIFSTVAFTTTHAHPNLYVEGDAMRPAEELDWGIGQLDTIYDRNEIKGNDFLTYLTFGDHALHHMFPTLDHSYLKYLYPSLEETLKKFNIKNINTTNTIDLYIGFYRQTAREVSKLTPPSLGKLY
ncbi:hypothetical protein FQR65_LT06432 [Abscondita terminalis]|nr:hypothetical protein FQR65_LT06432 [Abscondita terminalis]